MKTTIKRVGSRTKYENVIHKHWGMQRCVCALPLHLMVAPPALVPRLKLANGPLQVCPEVPGSHFHASPATTRCHRRREASTIARSAQRHPALDLVQQDELTSGRSRDRNAGQSPLCIAQLPHFFMPIHTKYFKYFKRKTRLWFRFIKVRALLAGGPRGITWFELWKGAQRCSGSLSSGSLSTCWRPCRVLQGSE